MNKISKDLVSFMDSNILDPKSNKVLLKHAAILKGDKKFKTLGEDIEHFCQSIVAADKSIKEALDPNFQAQLDPILDIYPFNLKVLDLSSENYH